MGTKLKLNKVVRRRGRPKGTKKTMTEFSEKNEVNRQTKRRNKLETVTKSKKRKICIESDSDDFTDISDVDKHISQNTQDDIECKHGQRQTRSAQWLPKLNLKRNDRDILYSDNWLNNRHIEAAQKLLKAKYPSINGLQSPLLAQHRSFDIIRNNMIQIIHCGSVKHWVAVSTVNSPDNTVYVYNSLDSDIPMAATEQICSIMYALSDKLTIISKPVQVQQGMNDCGLFAIAFATSIASGQDPQSLKYDQKLMRNHLLKCFQNNSIDLFPTEKSTNSHALTKVRCAEVPLICDCRFPDQPTSHFGFPHGTKLKCKTCQKSFHKSCIGNSKSSTYFLCKICL